MLMHEEAAIAYADAVLACESANTAWLKAAPSAAALAAIGKASKAAAKAWAKYKRERTAAEKVKR